MDEIPFVFVMLAGGLVASEIGFRLGAAFSPRSDSFAQHFDVIRTATFALSAFLIAFAFSGAGTRYVERLDIIVEEANAIGTAWLRADLLPEPQRGELKTELKEYTVDRVDMLSTQDQDEIQKRLAKVGDLQSRMWAAALAGTAGDAPLMNMVLPPLNDVFDLHTTHLALARRHLPLAIFVVLLSTAALSLVLVGFGHGRSGKRYLVLDGVYAAVLAVALWMTIDLDHPRQGLIQVTSQPLTDTLAGMK